MTRRLRTLLVALLIAVLVGTSGVFLGRQLATPTAAAEDPIETIAVDVLGPVGHGESAPLIDPADDGSGMPSSPILGTTTFPVDENGEPDLGAARLMDARGAAASDPGETGWIIDLIGAEGTHDECAPATGEPAADCPDGASGAILSLDSAPLWLRGSANVHEPDPTLPPHAVQCPIVETTADATQFGVVASAPGVVTVTYGVHGSTDTKTIRLDLTADQVADWEARTAATSDDELFAPAVQFCTILAGLQKYVTYEFTATITDDRGATASSDGWFRLAEDRVRPPAVIRPFGPGALYTSLLHKPEDRVQTTFHVLDPGETPDCSAPDDRLPAPTSRNYAVPVREITDDYLAANGWLPGYTERHSWFTTVPEGSDVLVCFSELRGNRPTWQWNDAQWRTWAVVTTPDYARPAVTAHSASLIEPVDARAIDVSITWGTGNCNLLSGPDTRSQELATGERPACDGGEYAPTQVDPLVHVSVTHKGETHRSRAVLPLSRIANTGGGHVPETSWFSIPLTVDVDEVEMCGSGLRAPCSRIEGYGTAGTVLLRVDWSEGATNGQTEWSISELQSEDIQHELHPVPQINYLHRDWEIISVAPHGGPVTARYVLETDRPVDYEITPVGDCVIDGEEMTRTGTTRGQTALTWRLCPGTQYHLEATLTDTDGNTAVHDAGTYFALYSRVVTPRYDTRLSVALRAEHTGTAEWDGQNTLLAELSLTIDGQRIDHGKQPDHCLSRPVYDRTAGTGLHDVALSAHTRVEVSILMVEAWGSQGGGQPPHCEGATTWGVPSEKLSAQVTLAELREGVTLTWDEGTDYAVTVTLRDYGPAR